MLGIGWSEMLVVGVVALIVIGPKELPALMQKLGRFAGTVRRMGSDFQRELNRSTGLNEVTNLRNAITQPLKTTTDAIRKEFNATTASGEVKPSGALKPVDPASESVVNEIHAAAGMSASETAKPDRDPLRTVGAPGGGKAVPVAAAETAAAYPEEKPKRARKQAAGAKPPAGPDASDPTRPVTKRVAAKPTPKASPDAGAAKAAPAAARPKRKRAAKNAARNAAGKAE